MMRLSPFFQLVLDPDAWSVAVLLAVWTRLYFIVEQVPTVRWLHFSVIAVGVQAMIGLLLGLYRSSVYEGVVLDDEVFCGPSMVFTNVINPRAAVERKDEFRPTHVRRGASLGANCTVICGVTIGTFAFVGAGSVVTRDVPDHALVTGVPARLRGWMCSCGEKLPQGDAPVCRRCARRYRMNGAVIAPA
jgi:UDP-2-acetamido-3-amino-2,3-dideoxy-glucuronate N-acetyltransferase